MGGFLDAAGLGRRASALLVLDGLRRVAPLREVVDLLAALAEHTGGDDLSGAPADAYGALFRVLARALTSESAGETPASRPNGTAGVAASSPDGNGDGDGAGDALAAALIDALLLDENPLSQAARHRRETGRALPAPLLAAAAADLRTLQSLVEAGPGFPRAVAQAAGLPQPPVWWSAESDVVDVDARGDIPAGADFTVRLAGAPDWGAMAEALAEHYGSQGSGPFARHRAFRWTEAAVGTTGWAGMTEMAGGMATRGGAGALRRLVPVPFPDAVRPGDLIGYAEERALLRRNTAQFLAGYPANNVLLYGDRGTGKSSSVKALLNERAIPGDGPAVDWDALRLIEVPKACLADFPIIVALLRQRPQRFILFVDDLSFEEGETQYKDMKAMLEGGIEARSPNVAVYATSNRRHLIREQFADRPPAGSDEVHARDTVQEKLSFADRFGLTITFPTPDQASYLDIVEGLASQRRLAVEPAALRARAIEWAAWHNGRSGRTARQFVDFLAGELGLRS